MKKPQSIGKAKLDKLNSLFRSCKHPAIVVHTNPDGDALGSGIALKHYLEEVRNVTATLIIPDKMPGTLAFLTKDEDILDAGKNPEKANDVLASCDLLVILDMNAFNRAEKLQTALETCPARDKVLIDHHLNPDSGSFSLVFSQPDISSASELLFWILRGIEGGAGKLPPKSLYAIMTGMTTDTNNFANSVFPTTLEMTRELLSAKVDRAGILEYLYQDYREGRIKAFADMLGNHLKILPGGIAYMVATTGFQQKYQLKLGETEGLVNLPLGIGKVKISIFAKQDGNSFRVSIRSKKGWSANDIARAYFSGGGHEQAAGGKILIPQDITDAGEVCSYIEDCAARFMLKK